MTTTSRASREIDGKGRTVRELLAGRKYSIDYYQREYKWQQKQVAELIDDLAAKFLESHEEGNERSAVADYGHYFLGSIIVSDKDGQKFIIDGQQRLTTLTLLLIFLHHQLDGRRAEGADRRSDLLAEVRQALVQPRHPRARGLHGGALQGRGVRRADAPESVANILARFADLEDLFPEELAGAGAAVLRGLAGGERAPRRDHRLLRRGRLHDLRDDERPRALAHARGHAEGLPAREHHRRREAHAGEPRLEGAGAGARRARQGRGRRRHQVVAAQPVRREHPRAQARRGAAGLRPDRHRVPPLGARPRGPPRPRRRAPSSRASSSATSPSTAAGTSGCAARPRR